jgi:predicted component of type VI protein secretion system
MRRSAGADNLPPVAAGQALEVTAHGVEFTAEFQELDALINAYDAEGIGPLRKGERPFQWDAVASAAEALLARAPDLRVAVWLLRAGLEQNGVSGMVTGLARIATLLALPEAEQHPRAQEGEAAR